MKFLYNVAELANTKFLYEDGGGDGSGAGESTGGDGEGTTAEGGATKESSVGGGLKGFVSKKLSGIASSIGMDFPKFYTDDGFDVNNFGQQFNDVSEKFKTSNETEQGNVREGIKSLVTGLKGMSSHQDMFDEFLKESGIDMSVFDQETPEMTDQEKRLAELEAKNARYERELQVMNTKNSIKKEYEVDLNEDQLKLLSASIEKHGEDIGKKLFLHDNIIGKQMQALRDKLKTQGINQALGEREGRFPSETDPDAEKDIEKMSDTERQKYYETLKKRYGYGNL